ncbi:hypothetical protein KPH14_009200 [Odynerus spinipes]|uniref:Odorant receptor n=1 Tax=Odynerus spinipes TaxID=1348599 RepID=A0AAD9RPB8_9HYME|nr:hypothetical protein KPH14_009200 [Odynerus spinipes]
MPIALYNVMVFMKYNCLLMNQKNIIRCIEYLEDDLERIIDPCHRDIIKSKVRYGKRFFVVICVFMHVTVFYWRICVPLVKGNVVTAENITIRPLPSTGYYFNLFDDQVSPFYEVIFILQCLQGLVTIYINIIICTLAVIFVMHACSQLEIFINLLESVVVNAESDKENTNFKLAVAVKHHIRVRRFLQKIENTMNPLYFMDIFGCSATIIFLAYCLMMDWNAHQLKNVAPYIISLSSVTFQIFVFCFVGEQLTLQDEKVALKSCVLEWNRIPYKEAKNVIPIVILSNCRMKITAGSIVELSLHTFGQVIKTSVGYCNMMRTIMQ